MNDNISITVSLVLSDIPDDEQCVLCKASAYKQYLEWQTSYIADDRKHIMRCGQLPGYVCSSCGDETIHLKAAIEVLQAALVVVTRAGDRNAQQQLETQLSIALYVTTNNAIRFYQIG